MNKDETCLIENKGLSFVFSIKDDRIRKFKMEEGFSESIYCSNQLIEFYGAFTISNNCYWNNDSSTNLTHYERPH